MPKGSLKGISIVPKELLNLLCRLAIASAVLGINYLHTWISYVMNDNTTIYIYKRSRVHNLFEWGQRKLEDLSNIFFVSNGTNPCSPATTYYKPTFKQSSTNTHIRDSHIYSFVEYMFWVCPTLRHQSYQSQSNSLLPCTFNIFIFTFTRFTRTYITIVWLDAIKSV